MRAKRGARVPKKYVKKLVHTNYQHRKKTFGFIWPGFEIFVLNLVFTATTLWMIHTALNQKFL